MVLQYGEGSLVFKGQTAISSVSTKCEFLSLHKNEKLDEINTNVAEIKKKINTVYDEVIARQENKDIIKLKDKIGLPVVPLEIDSKAIQNVFNERFIKMSIVLQKIIMAVQSAFH